MGPWAKTATVSPILMSPLSAPEMPVEAISATNDLFVTQIIGNLCKVCLRHSEPRGIRLRAIVVFPTSILRLALHTATISAQTVIALATGVRSDQYSGLQRRNL